MITSELNTPTSRPNDGYSEFAQSLQKTYEEMTSNGENDLYMVSTVNLFNEFLNMLPEEGRQHYNCQTCKRFVETYGGLVTIKSGEIKSVLWSEDVPCFFKVASIRLKQLVEESKVIFPFYTKGFILGTPTTGEWNHMHLKLTNNLNSEPNFVSKIATKKEDYILIKKAVSLYDIKHVETIIELCQTDNMYRGDKILPMAKWFRDVLAYCINEKNKRTKEIVLWQVSNKAPVGFCHINNTVLGTLLDDLNTGMSYEDIKRRYQEKMDPLQYQRPQSLPTEGNIKRAEKLIEELGIEDSLHRRYATLEEVNKYWTPTERKDNIRVKSIFAHLKTKDQKTNTIIETKEKNITWKRFVCDILPIAKNIGYKTSKNVPDSYGAIVTEAISGSKPIIRWDNESDRNPFSHYMYAHGSFRQDWNLSKEYTKVTAIGLLPQHSKLTAPEGNAILYLEGAKDANSKICGNALFPEILKSELREIRSTIEAYSKTAELGNSENASACGVIKQSGSMKPFRLIVNTELATYNYLVDRWE